MKTTLTTAIVFLFLGLGLAQAERLECNTDGSYSEVGKFSILDRENIEFWGEILESECTQEASILTCDFEAESVSRREYTVTIDLDNGGRGRIDQFLRRDGGVRCKVYSEVML